MHVTVLIYACLILGTVLVGLFMTGVVLGQRRVLRFREESEALRRRLELLEGGAEAVRRDLMARFHGELKVPVRNLLRSTEKARARYGFSEDLDAVWVASHWLANLVEESGAYLESCEASPAPASAMEAAELAEQAARRFEEAFGRPAELQLRPGQAACRVDEARFLKALEGLARAAAQGAGEGGVSLEAEAGPEGLRFRIEVSSALPEASRISLPPIGRLGCDGLTWAHWMASMGGTLQPGADPHTFAELALPALPLAPQAAAAAVAARGVLAHA